MGYPALHQRTSGIVQAVVVEILLVVDHPQECAGRDQGQRLQRRVPGRVPRAGGVGHHGRHALDGDDPQRQIDRVDREVPFDQKRPDSAGPFGDRHAEGDIPSPPSPVVNVSSTEALVWPDCVTSPRNDKASSAAGATVTVLVVSNSANE